MRFYSYFRYGSLCFAQWGLNVRNVNELSGSVILNRLSNYTKSEKKMPFHHIYHMKHFHIKVSLVLIKWTHLGTKIKKKVTYGTKSQFWILKGHALILLSQKKKITYKSGMSEKENIKACSILRHCNRKKKYLNLCRALQQKTTNYKMKQITQTLV